MCARTRGSCARRPFEMAEQTDETLSRRAEVFRSKLIEEFQLLDCLSEKGRTRAPVYSSSNISEGEVPAIGVHVGRCLAFFR